MSKTIGYGETTITNVTEPFTVMLTNEAQQFATDSNRKVTSAQSYYTDIIVIQGTQERKDYTIGTITSGSNITVSKSGTRVTFSVSAGTTISADAGVIEIPITLDGQTVKKQFSWSCGKQGPQGIKGEDGTSVKITSKSVTYQASTSGTTAPTGTWSTSVPTVNNGQYLWTKTTVQYSDGNKTEAYSVSYKGTNGTNGTSVTVSKTEVTYQVSTSGTTTPTGTWSTTMPTCDQGLYLWTKTYVQYSDGKNTTSYSVSYKGIDGEDGAGFHWNLLKHSGDLSKQVLSGAGTCTATVESIEDKTTPSGQAEKITYTTQGTGGKYIQTGKYIKEGDIQQGKTYTVSVWCKCSSTKSAGVINAEFLDNKTYVRPTLSTEWQQYVVTGVANKDVSSTSSGSAISFYYGDGMAVGDIFYISSPKVEQSDKASPWCTTYEETLAKSISITPSAQYFKSTDGGKTFAPNNITITPTLQGEISFGKWQYSIDGGVSFADVVSGQKGLTISNNVLTVSKDSSLFTDTITMVTFRAVANDSSFYDTCSIAKFYDTSDIGDGRNVLWNSNFADTSEAITNGNFNSWGLHYRGTNLVSTIDTSVTHNGFNTLKAVSSANGDKNLSNDLEWFARGISEKTSDDYHSKSQNYTLSFYAKASVATDFIVRWGYDSYGTDTTKTLTTDWQRYEIKLHTATIAYSVSIIFKLLTAGTVWFSEFKLEKGSSATGYSTAPEDVQTAILSTKSEISDVSLKVNKNAQAIEERVTKTTYEDDLTVVRGNIDKANEGLNKWIWEIYPKSLFASEDQSKYTMDVFARNKNLVPSQTVLLDDASLSTGMKYRDSYIAYSLTFIKMSASKSITTTFYNDDGASFYVNGKLIVSAGSNYTTGTSITFSLVQGWNCLEVVLNEGNGTEGFRFAQTLSKLSECQLMNCYYGTPVARQSHITNQLVENTTNISGVTTTVQDVMTTVGDSGNITDFKTNYTKWKQGVDGIESRVGSTYTTKDEFNGLEIGGRNLLLNSKTNIYYDGYQTDVDGFIEGYHVASSAWHEQHYKLSIKNDDTIKHTAPITISAYVKAPNGSLGGAYFGLDLRNSSGRLADLNCNLNDFKNHEQINEDTWTYVSFTATSLPDTFSQNGQWNLQIKTNSSFATGSKFGYKKIKVEFGNKATSWTPAPEDDEINGQNLVSNLPSNWEQGSVQYNAGSLYSGIKTVLASRLRTKDVFSVSDNVTVSAGTSTNSSKEELNFYYVLFDVNKKAIGVPPSGSEWQSLTSAKTINCGDAKYMAIILRWGSGTTTMNPSDISSICLKVERGTSATAFTLAPEDVNGKIMNVETIANQTAKKFEWIVKGESTSSNLVLTDNALTAIANNINLTGKVTFNSFDQSLKNTINNKTNVSYLAFYSQGDTKAYFKIATLKVGANYVNQAIIIGVNHRNYGYTECRIRFQNSSSTDPGMGPFQQTGLPTKAWRIVKTGTSTWDLYLAKAESYDGGNVVKYINPYTSSQVSVTWSGTNANLPDNTFAAEQMIADQTTIDGGIITTGYISADRIAASSITADKIAAGTITANSAIIADAAITNAKIQSIDATKITTGQLSADRIDVTGIFAKDITATGTITGVNLVGATGTFSGNVTATEGKIGRYDITSTYLMTNSGNNASGIGGNQAFWAGSEDSSSAPFRVGYDGSLVAENATIYGTIQGGDLGEEGGKYFVNHNGISIQGVESECSLYVNGFKFEFNGDYYLKAVSDGVECYRNFYTTDLYVNGWTYAAMGSHYTWQGQWEAYFTCGNYSGSNNIYYYAGYHAFYVTSDSGSGMFYVTSNGCSSRKGFSNTSDERIKQNFSHFDDNFIDTYMNLEPVKYQFKNDTNDKYHFGFKAQQTEKVLNDYGESYNEEYGLCATHAIDPEKAEKLYGVKDMYEEYTLAYDELIAPTTYMVQYTYKELESTKEELTRVKQEKADLETRLAAIEAKLGL